VVTVKLDKHGARAERPRRNRGRQAFGRAFVAMSTVAAFLSVAEPVQAAAGELVDVVDTEVHELTPEFADRVRAEARVNALAQTCYIVYLYNVGLGRYVSAELDYSGSSYAMLRARATAVGPYERFNYCWDSAGFAAFQSRANGKWVAAEMDNVGSSYAMLRARSNSIGNWEKFTYVNENGNFYFQSLSNSRWWRAESLYSGSSYGMVRAANTSRVPGNGILMFWRTIIG
jgi:hypothetical protein